jgi:hypothetical protein
MMQQTFDQITIWQQDIPAPDISHCKCICSRQLAVEVMPGASWDDALRPALRVRDCTCKIGQPSLLHDSSVISYYTRLEFQARLE